MVTSCPMHISDEAFCSCVVRNTHEAFCLCVLRNTHKGRGTGSCDSKSFVSKKYGLKSYIVIYDEIKSRYTI